LLAGFEFARQETTSERINGFFTSGMTSSGGRRVTVPLADPLVSPGVEFRAGPTGAGNRDRRARRTCSLSTSRIRSPSGRSSI
jgi:hypothetical protein